MAKKDVCEAPVCRSTKKDTVCSVTTPIYGAKGGCRTRKKSEFDSRSFYEKRSGNAFITIGCLKGNWDARKGRCRTGTRAYKIRIPR